MQYVISMQKSYNVATRTSDSFIQCVVYTFVILTNKITDLSPIALKHF